MPGATIYDVAERARVSIATVSRVLNTPEQVNAATRLRVIAAIDELGFVPRAEATARARKATGRVGVLAPFFTYPSFVQRLRGVATALSGSAYDLLIFNVDSAARRDAYLASLAVNRRLDGLIVMALPFSRAIDERLAAQGLEVVLIEGRAPHFSSIEIDDVAGGRLVAEYLIGCGHRRFGFVGDTAVPDYAIHTSDRRLAGFRQALREHGYDLPDTHIALGVHGLRDARTQAHSLLDLPCPPTAIFAPSDTQAIGVLKAARERGLRVPDDLAVIGFDDLEIADYIGLTTVRQPLDESGRIAVELLAARLADRSRPVQHITLPLRLIRRETA